jgi:hypothetical protein
VISDQLDEVHVTSIEGVGSSYRMSGFFTLRSKTRSSVQIEFSGVAFGGNYGGHNVSVEISDEAKTALIASTGSTAEEIEDLLSEVQRKMLNNEIIVEFDKIKPPEEKDAI